jgi:2-polyprenyl-6-methoxyphenol hydroxylase-like FAD-dependent oxidoreductase
MKILIIGGGIGGLAAAGFLQKKGFDITLVEQAPEFKHIGFGMSLFSNGRFVLRELGIDEEVARNGYIVPGLGLNYPDGSPLGQRLDFIHLKKLGAPVITIERAALHEALVKNLKNLKMCLGTTVKKITNNDDGAEVEFSDGTKEKFDLVVAADGIHSQIRQDFFEANAASYYGWSVRAFWAPAHAYKPSSCMCLSEERAILALYPLKEKDLVALYEYNPQKISHPPINLKDFTPFLLKHGWTEEDISSVKEESMTGKQFYDHLHRISLGEWFKKRIVLLGDARHATSPITGMGGSMALEDAFVLADELGKHAPNNIPLALKNYSERRTRRIKQMRTLTDLVEKFYFVTSPLGRMIRDFLCSVLSPRFFTDKLEKILATEI